MLTPNSSAAIPSAWPIAPTSGGSSAGLLKPSVAGAVRRQAGGHLRTEMNAETGTGCSDREQELALKLFVVLSRAHTAVARITESDIAGYRLSPGEFAILEELYQR